MLQHYFFALSDRLIRLGCGVIVNLVLVVHLQPRELGAWNYLLSLFAIGNAIAIFSGLDALVIRDLARGHGKPENVLASCGSLRFLAGSISAIFMVWYVTSASSGLRYLSAVLGLCFITQTLHSLDYMLQAHLKYRLSAMIANACTLCSCTLKVWLASRGALDLQRLCWLTFAESLALGILLVVATGRVFPSMFRARVTLTPAALAKYFWAASPLMLSGLLNAFAARISVIQIAHYLDLEKAAVYGVFLFVFEAALTVNYTLLNVFFPKIMVAHRTTAYKNQVQQLLRRQIYLGLGTVASAWIFGYAAHGLLLGSNHQTYAESLELLGLAAPAIILYVLNLSAIQFAIIPSNRVFQQLIRSALALVTVVLFNAILVPRIGLPGSVVSMAISQLLALALIAPFALRYINGTAP